MKNFPTLAILKGIASYIPILFIVYKKIRRETAHSCSNARFCYSLWLRIFVTMSNANLQNHKGVIAELGPSSSFGVGLVALLTGSKSYTALEVVKSEIVEKNLRIFEELIFLLRHKVNIPDDNEFPRINIKLDSYLFPCHFLTDVLLNDLLSEKRIEKIREAIINCNYSSNIQIINYYVPWEKNSYILENTFDFVFSRSVMEHIIDYPKIYYLLKGCLKDNGIMFHDIDYHNHKIGKQWNGHWCYSNFLWKIIAGNRPSFINRATHSMHTSVMKHLAFNILAEYRTQKISHIARKCLSKQFKSMTEEDLNTCGGYIIALKHIIQS